MYHLNGVPLSSFLGQLYNQFRNRVKIDKIDQQTEPWTPDNLRCKMKSLLYSKSAASKNRQATLQKSCEGRGKYNYSIIVF